MEGMEQPAQPEQVTKTPTEASNSFMAGVSKRTLDELKYHGGLQAIAGAVGMLSIASGTEKGAIIGGLLMTLPTISAAVLSKRM